MDAALRLRLGHALHPVYAAFELQLRIGVAVDLESDLVEPAFLTRRDVDDLDLPALLLGPLLVHAEQVRGEQRRMLPALGALDLNDHVPVVVRIFWQQQDLQVLLELSDLRSRAPLLGTKKFLHLCVLLVAEHVVRRFHLVLRAPVALVRGDDLSQPGLLASELGQPRMVGRHLGARHLRLDLAVASRDRLQSVNHAAASCSSPSRALLKAAIATSSMSSEGSRVVNFCVPSTGSSSTWMIGFVRWRAM